MGRCVEVRTDGHWYRQAGADRQRGKKNHMDGRVMDESSDEPTANQMDRRENEAKKKHACRSSTKVAPDRNAHRDLFKRVHRYAHRHASGMCRHASSVLKFRHTTKRIHACIGRPSCTPSLTLSDPPTAAMYHTSLLSLCTRPTSFSLSVPALYLSMQQTCSPCSRAQRLLTQGLVSTPLANASTLNTSPSHRISSLRCTVL